MAKDIDLSADLMVAYKEHRAHFDASDSFDLSVNVLTTGNWPSFSSSNAILPAEMIASLDRFKRFYGSKHTGRNLAWQHSLDQCVVKAAFPKGKKELSVSLFQGLCLLLFNGLPDGTKLGFKDIVTLTGLGESAKQSLCASHCLLQNAKKPFAPCSLWLVVD
jgi:cullin-4